MGKQKKKNLWLVKSKFKNSKGADDIIAIVDASTMEDVENKDKIKVKEKDSYVIEKIDENDWHEIIEDSKREYDILANII